MFIEDVPIQPIPPASAQEAAVEAVEQISVEAAETVDRARKVTVQALHTISAAEVAVQKVKSIQPPVQPVIDLTQEIDVKSEPVPETTPWQPRDSPANPLNPPSISLRASPPSLGPDFWSECYRTPRMLSPFQSADVQHPKFFINSTHRLLEAAATQSIRCLFHSTVCATHNGYCPRCGQLRLCFACYDHITAEGRTTCPCCNLVDLENQIYTPMY